MERKELKELFDYHTGLNEEHSKLTLKLKEKWFFQILSKTSLKWKIEDLENNLTKAKSKFNNNLNQFLLHDNYQYQKLVSTNQHNSIISN